MDFTQRLKNMEERRGESIDTTLERNQQETGLSVNDYIVGFAEALAEADKDETVEIMEALGGLEHYRPYELMADSPFFFTGLEAPGDGVMRIFDRIIAFIKRWLKVLADADFKLSLMTGIHQNTLENIRTEMRSSGHSQRKNPKFIVGTRIDSLCINYRPITNAGNLLNALTVLRRITGVYFDKHDAYILRQVNKVVAAVNAKANAEQIAAIIKEVSPRELGTDGIFKLNDGRIESPHLLGNHRFIVDHTDDHSSSLADNVVGVRIKMERSQETNSNPPGAIEFDRFDNSMGEAILNKCESILGALSESNSGPRRAGRRHGMGALLAAIENVRNNYSDRDEADAQRTVAVLESYIAWIADPYTSIYAYVLRTVKACLNVVALNSE